MRVAALYDIHGNLPALEAVLDELRQEGVERIVVGGDVLPGPMPRECMARLARLDLPAEFIVGNGDREVLAWMRGQHNAALPKLAQEAIGWVAQELKNEHETVLAAWPAVVRLEVKGLGRVLFCHATPRSDTENFTRLTPDDELASAFRDCGADIVICGHTHMQFDRRIGKVRVLNAGSVGMPFGVPGAYWLLLDSNGAQLRRTSYDRAKTAEEIRKTGYPQANDFAEHNVLHPPSEEAMLAVLTGAK